MKKMVQLAALLLALSACSPPAPIVPEKSDIEKVQEYNKIEGVTTDPAHGKTVAFWYGALSGVDGQAANGIAYMNKFEDGASRVTVNLNIPLASGGKHYVAYVQGADSSTAVNVGELLSIIGDARHSVSLDTKEDISALLTVNVYLAESVDAAQGILVATGMMKASK